MGCDEDQIAKTVYVMVITPVSPVVENKNTVENPNPCLLMAVQQSPGVLGLQGRHLQCGEYGL